MSIAGATKIAAQSKRGCNARSYKTAAHFKIFNFILRRYIAVFCNLNAFFVAKASVIVTLDTRSVFELKGIQKRLQSPQGFLPVYLVSVLSFTLFSRKCTISFCTLFTSDLRDLTEVENFQKIASCLFNLLIKSLALYETVARADHLDPGLQYHLKGKVYLKIRISLNRRESVLQCLLKVRKTLT